MSSNTIAIGALLEVQAQPNRTRLQGAAQCVNAEHASIIEVPELWPGERAQVRILARSRHQDLYFAKLHTLLEPHPQRIAPPCSHHPQQEAKPACGGCPWMSLSVPAQRELKRELLQTHFARELGPVQGGEALGYRYASKRICGRVRGRLALGSYVPKSHQLAPMRDCQVDHPLLTAAFNHCEDLLIKHRVAPFDEKLDEGEVRFVWGKCSGQGVHITAIGAHEKSPRLQAALQELSEILGPGNAVSWQLHEKKGNAMRADTATTRIDAHPELPSLELLGQTTKLDALGFLQPNPLVAQDCYRALLGLQDPEPPTGVLALDLYAGAGATSLALAKRFSQVLACEQRPPQGAAPMVQASSVEDFLGDFCPQSSGTPDFIIANPPRSGLSELACERLAAIAAPRLGIMSCGPKALAKNLAQLCAAGYELVELQAFDPLPHTAHVEVVAQLRRSS